MEEDQKVKLKPHQLMESLYGICLPLCIAKTLNLEHTQNYITEISSHHRSPQVSTSQLLFLPFKELMFCVGHDHVTRGQSRAELLSEQPHILREHFGTILKQHRQDHQLSTSGLQNKKEHK